MKPRSKDANSLPKLPIYLLYGDEFLVKQELNRIVDRVLGSDLRKTNLTVFTGADLDEGTFFASVRTCSLFGHRRVIVVEDTTLFSGLKDAGRLASRVANAAQSGDESLLLRYMGQFLRMAGITSSEVIKGDEWLEAIHTDDLSSSGRDLLRQTANKWLESRHSFDAPLSDTLVEELIHRPPPEGTVVIFTAESVDTKKQAFRLVAERGNVQECLVDREKFVQKLNRSYFDNHVKATLAECGKTVSRDALARMYVLAGTDLRRLQAELNKVLNYVGEKRHIDVSDVDDVFDDFHGAEFFELSAAIRTGDLERCLKALYEHMKIVAHPLQTLSAIAGEVRRLLMVKELREKVFGDSWSPSFSFSRFKSLLATKASREGNPEVASKIAKTRMKPYSMYVSLQACDKFAEDRLLQALEDLLTADIIFKSSSLGRYDPQVILENVLFRLMRKS